MNQRLLVAVLVVQSLLLALLVGERLVPVAHAAEPVRCEIANWPGALTGQGFDAVRVKVDDIRTPVPVEVKGWSTYDEVRVKQ